VRLRKADLENPVFIAGLLRDGHWNLARRCGNAEVIRAALDELEGLSDLATLFLRSAVPGPAVVAQWVAAIDALRSLHRVSSGFGEKWGSRRREARIRALAQVPELVEGVRAVVVASTDLVEPDWFAVLAADASPESVDALLPQVARALARYRQTLDALWAVVSRPGLHAALRPLGDALEAERRRIFTQAGVTALATKVGLAEHQLQFRLELDAGAVQASVTVDGASAQPLLGRVDVRRPRQKVASTDLAGRDLESGMAVFRQALTKLAPAQRLVELFTGLRGKRSRLLVEWLERALQAKVLVGGTRPPVRLDEGLLSALAKLRVQQQ
jgi:hypothetical protein